MPKFIPVLFFSAFVSVCGSACFNRCYLDNADSPVEPISSVRLLIKDSVTGENLVGIGRRYHPDSIFRSGGYFYGSLPAPAQIEMTGSDTAIVVTHYGTLDGEDCKGRPYPRRVGSIDSVFLHLSAADTDTIAVASMGTGDIVLSYNGQTILTTAYSDNTTRTVDVRK